MLRTARTAGPETRLPTLFRTSGVLGTAGTPGLSHTSNLAVPPGDVASRIYIEGGTGVSAFVLAGPYAEPRARRPSGAALKALLAHAANDASMLCKGRKNVSARSVIAATWAPRLARRAPPARPTPTTCKGRAASLGA